MHEDDYEIEKLQDEIRLLLDPDYDIDDKWVWVLHRTDMEYRDPDVNIECKRNSMRRTQEVHCWRKFRDLLIELRSFYHY